MTIENDLPLFASARTSDPITSQLNRDAFSKKMTQRDALLRTYAIEWFNYEKSFGEWCHTDGGLTDEECGQRTWWVNATMYDARICYWKRCSELRKLGFIEPTGWTRASDCGHLQQVCQITDLGREHLRSLNDRG